MSSFLEVMGELKAALDEHDRLTERVQVDAEEVRDRLEIAAAAERDQKAGRRPFACESKPRCLDDPRIEEADIRNRLPDPMEEVEENHAADALEVSDPRAPSPPSTIQGGGGIGGS